MTENGRSRETCRGRGENSNASIVGSAYGSGFVAAIRPATVEIFSIEIRCVALDVRVPNRYAGANPKVRSKRLA
jgi:hypothetical protein